MPAAMELTGRVFGRLTVLRRDYSKPKGVSYWLCQCSCGNTHSAIGKNLKTGTTSSCGCLRSEMVANKNSRYGNDGVSDPRYSIWLDMKRRCFDATRPGYRLYGARGISVCDKWASDFEAFCSDMGERPSPAHSIDRIDNDGNYEPGNCRWADRPTQMQNKRTNIVFRYKGEVLCLKEISRRSGVSYSSLCDRYRRGLPAEKILPGLLPANRVDKCR